MGGTQKAWIGVDLDGTLALYDGWQGPTIIGDPVPKMLKRVKDWLRSGKTVKIVTARVAPRGGEEDECRKVITEWLERQGIGGLEITHAKDYGMVELWDDRAVQVIPNTGERADGRE